MWGAPQAWLQAPVRSLITFHGYPQVILPHFPGKWKIELQIHVWDSLTCGMCVYGKSYLSHTLFYPQGTTVIILFLIFNCLQRSKRDDQNYTLRSKCNTEDTYKRHVVTIICWSQATNFLTWFSDLTWQFSKTLNKTVTYWSPCQTPIKIFRTVKSFLQAEAVSDWVSS